MSRDFKGIWIPKDIWLTKNLTLQEKVFLAEIDSLDNEDGCFASNQHFSDLFGLSKTRVSLVIKSLIEKEAIESRIIYKEGTKQILKRVLKVCYRGYLRNVKYPPQEKLKGIYTINNTNNNTKKKETSFSNEIESTFDEVVKLFPKKTIPYTIDARNKWKNELRKLNEIDKLTFKEIIDLSRWAREDSFWSTNFLSLLKLRKKNKEGIPYFVIFAESMKPKQTNQKDESIKKIRLI